MTAPPVVTSPIELVSLVSSWRDAGDTVALVPTMGALHDGHLALVTRAKQECDRVVVSVFVNPLQFAEGEDFDRYPRSLGHDVAMLAPHDVDAVFAPDVSDVYPAWPQTTVTHRAGPVGGRFEGADRPGHFDGVVTVVSRLFDLVGCDVAVFGQKDAQQVFLIRELAATRTPPVTISVVDTVRDTDGLARSSRNRFLSEEARVQALSLPAAVAAFIDTLGAVTAATRAEQIEDALAAQQSFLLAAGLDVHYFEVVSAETFEPWRGGTSGEVVVIAACTVGGVRLLDAAAVTIKRGLDD